MRKIQSEIKHFNDVRGWSSPEQIKDLLLNFNEEIGEFWNIIKWVDINKQTELIRKNHDEVENFIGDMIYLVMKIANLCHVDSQNAIESVMAEYEKRFPIESVRGKHANVKAGGIDKKVDSSK
ncbi:MAG: MazG-like family protein [Bdellovibrionota bacterium]